MLLKYDGIVSLLYTYSNYILSLVSISGIERGSQIGVVL